MGLKKYILGSFLLILAVFGYVFSIESGDYRVEILDIILVLPIALWIIAPVLLLFVMSVLHILFYGLKNYFSIKAVSKDTSSMISLLSKKLLNESSSVSFKNKEFKELSEVINQLDINCTDSNFSSSSKEIDKIVEQIFTIKSGKYISTKDLKLPNDNAIMIENLKNRVEVDENFALEAIKKTSNYSAEVVKVAFEKVLEKKSITTIKKNINEVEFDTDMLIALLKKDSEQDIEFSMTNEEILKLITKVKLSNDDLILIAKNYKAQISPDQIIKLYEDISAVNEEYTTAYLFILAEYEMIDKMRDILVNSAPSEYTAFKALIDLKDAGKHTYSLSALCYK